MGNPNPSPATRFKKGGNANPSGKSKEQKRIELEAAQMSAQMRHDILTSMMEKIADPDDEATVLSFFDPKDLIKLFKDSEDRGFGLAKATHEHTGQDGGPIVVSPSDKLAEILDAISIRKAS